MPYTPDPIPDDVLAQIGFGFADGSAAAAGAFNIDSVFGETDPRALEYQRLRGLELAKLVPDNLRQHVNDILDMILDEGLGMDEAGRLLEGAFGFDGAYADMLARTETAKALNQGAIATYTDAGFSHVLVFDGDGCDECHDINGEVWTLEEAESNDTEHPSCVRSFSPIALTAAEMDQEEAA